jgi:hypothetical protein
LSAQCHAIQDRLQIERLTILPGLFVKLSAAASLVFCNLPLGLARCIG